MSELEMAGTVKDPVCGMEVSPEVARERGLTAEYEGRTYYFCGKGCMLDFQDDPAKVFEPGYQPHM